MTKNEKDDLKRIANTLDHLARRQEEICERLDRLERSASGLEAADAAASPEDVIEFLDQFRAGEALGEASLGAWIEVCKSEALRGSLRVIQMREGFHARLLEARIKELGGSPSAEIPEKIFETSMKQSASKKTSDADKLAAFMARFPDADQALAPIQQMANRLEGDPETQYLLRTICQDERATLECLAQHCEALAQAD